MAWLNELRRILTNQQKLLRGLRTTSVKSAKVHLLASELRTASHGPRDHEMWLKALKPVSGGLFNSSPFLYPHIYLHVRIHTLTDEYTHLYVVFRAARKDKTPAKAGPPSIFTLLSLLTDEAYQHGQMVGHMQLSPPLSERSVSMVVCRYSIYTCVLSA